uniref:DUF148 domain-containing protein n=1 Tax=Ascaris lumbricoides TaxID=6252 RepID=A0A0M3HRP7_ASCLU
MKARVAPSSLARFSTRFLFTPYRSNFCASNFYYSWRRFTCLVQSRIFISLRAVWTFAYSTNKHIFFKKEICICGMSLLASGEVNVAADRASVFFFVQSTPSGQFTASAVSSSGQVWTSSYSSEEWIKIYEEGGAASNEQFFEWLNDANSKITAETNDNSLEIKWSKEDEEGFFFEICSLHLVQEPPNAFIRLFRSLLNDRSAFYEKATNTEAQLDEMRNQMEKLEQRASQLSEFCSNLETTLISKFTTILNEKLKKK